MTLDFKKVIRESFVKEISNIESSSILAETKKIEECRNEYQDKTNDCTSFTERKGEKMFYKKTRGGSISLEVSPDISRKRSTILKSNLNYNSRHYIISSTDNNKEVPEWHKVFKDILGNNTTEFNASLPQKHVFSSQEHVFPSQKHKNAIKTKYSMKNASVHPSKNIEEKKVRELFALSRSFKLHDYLQHNMNEYEGVGVNIFKSCDSKAREILHQKSTQSLNSVKWMNNSYHCNSKPFQPYTPLTGFIAAKPYVRDEMENSAHIPLSEVWDEDFYF